MGCCQGGLRHGKGLGPQVSGPPAAATKAQNTGASFLCQTLPGPPGDILPLLPVVTGTAGSPRPEVLVPRCPPPIPVKIRGQIEPGLLPSDEIDRPVYKSEPEGMRLTAHRSHGPGSPCSSRPGHPRSGAPLLSNPWSSDNVPSLWSWAPRTPGSCPWSDESVRQAYSRVICAINGTDAPTT